ncbi:MAG TPA: MDR family MFS transporter [Anaeromyxobacteraceae bacterium]|nr:MDR family MFS transporter [Anaeromyxobacteraceae bacterium]
MKTRRPLTVVALLLSLFIAAMEMTVVSTAMPTAVGDLGGLHLFAWAFASYMLAATVTVPIWGKLADLHGRKPVMQIGTVLFLAGSAACGFAPSMEWLIFFRTVQGLGAGAMQPIALTIVGDLFDVHERARIQGVFGAVWGLAGLVGPLLGGAIVHSLSWRWVFWINLPVGIASLLVLQAAFHERVERHPHGLDVAGAVTLSLAVVAVLVGARSAQQTLVAIPVACAALAAFVWQERRAPEPLVPLDLFKEPVLAVASAAGALVGAAMFALTSYLPLYAQALLGATPTGAGSAIAPMAIGWPIASAIGGRLIPRIGFRPLVRGGLFIAAAASVVLCVTLRPGVSLHVPRVLTALYGLGLGFANTALIIAVQSSVPWQRRGVATASTLFFRTIGGTLAVGVLGGVLTAVLSGGGVDAAVAEKLLGPERTQLDASLVASASSALAGGMQVVFWAVAALAVLAFAVSLAFPKVLVRPASQQRSPAPDPR